MKLSRGENGSIQAAPAVAKSYAVEDNLDGTETYTFTLRQNARWSDGKAVTAHDFVYAWQRLADPATGSPHAALLDVVAGYSQARESRTEAFCRCPPRTTSPLWCSCRISAPIS